MANVLPPGAKKQLKKFYRARFLYVGALVLFFTALLCMCALLPTYIALRINEAYQVRSSQDMAEAVSKNSEDKAAIDRTQGILKQINMLLYATSTPSDTVAIIFKDLPKSAQISRIHFTPGAVSTVSIIGTADGRETIETFRKTLMAESGVDSATVPVGDLLGKSGSQFDLTLTGNF